MTGKRLVLVIVAVLMSVVAALAIGILLFGDFGATEGRILATTAVLAGYGVLALPAAILQDRRRLLGLAMVVFALAVAGASVTVAAIWAGEPPEALGKAIGTVNGWLIAAVQVAALALRRDHDPRSARWLFTASSGLVVVLAAMLTTLVWAEIDSEVYGRVFGALVVLDVLLVALQPVVARVRPAGTLHRLRIVVAPDETVELTVEATDLASAAAKGIRMLEHDGRRVLLLDFADPTAERNLAAAAEGERAHSAFTTPADRELATRR